jgi:alpha-glucoside transport system substrate-binding protein
MARTGWARGAVLAMIGALIVAACSSGASPSGGGKVTVIGTWAGTEQDNFLAMVKPWEDQTGNKVEYTGTRDLDAVLATGIASGLTPDVAGIPGPGAMVDYYAAGGLKPLDDVLDTATYKADTAEGLVKLGTASDGKIIGIFIKADIKGLIWYNKDVWDGSTPATFDDLVSQGAAKAASLGGGAKTWCMAFESGAATGWPATDWIENIVLHQAGPDVYDGWIKGDVKWTDPAIKKAWQTFGDFVSNAYGGSQYILATNFTDVGAKMFSTPPGCVFANMATFITDPFVKQSGARADQFDFFAFPDMDPMYAGAVEGSGDLFGMFNDTPQARSLMKYLATPEAQSIWVGAGGAMSANKKVTNYPTDVLKKAAEALTSAKIFRFDAGDAMPSAMNTAFFQKAAEYVQHPENLDQILTELQAVRDGL